MDKEHCKNCKHEKKYKTTVGTVNKIKLPVVVFNAGNMPLNTALNLIMEANGVEEFTILIEFRKKDLIYILTDYEQEEKGIKASP